MTEQLCEHELDSKMISRHNSLMSLLRNAFICTFPSTIYWMLLLLSWTQCNLNYMNHSDSLFQWQNSNIWITHFDSRICQSHLVPLFESIFFVIAMLKLILCTPLHYVYLRKCTYSNNEATRHRRQIMNKMFN